MQSVLNPVFDPDSYGAEEYEVKFTDETCTQLEHEPDVPQMRFIWEYLIVRDAQGNENGYERLRCLDFPYCLYQIIRVEDEEKWNEVLRRFKTYNRFFFATYPGRKDFFVLQIPGQGQRPVYTPENWEILEPHLLAGRYWAAVAAANKDYEINPETIHATTDEK